ncbi:MAG: hypothetical protein AAFN30_16550, partial [Actinomycetota bacterium]
ILGGLAALTIGAFLLGRSNGGDEDPVTTPTVATTPLASAPASPASENALAAVDAWETYARSGDLAAVGRVFDPDGPQYAMLEAGVADPRSEEVDFDARNLRERTEDGITTVSMDLVVSGATGQAVYPYDFVYLGDSDRVWTVIDRRSPGTVALPPPDEIVASARQSWSLFASSLAIGDGAGASTVVGVESRELSAQVGRAVAGEVVAEPLVPAGVFELLVDRAAMTNAREPDEVLVTLLDADQRQAIAIGELSSWTMVEDERVVASLDVAGQSVATVPFVASAEGWAFDLKGALESTGSTENDQTD